MQRFKANYSKDDDDETDSVLDDAVVDFDDLVLDDAFYKVTSLLCRKGVMDVGV